jgi:myo-inositol 2-dehydrogenase/D-chiro-inositol 1-dehydrogenase
LKDLITYVSKVTVKNFKEQLMKVGMFGAGRMAGDHARNIIHSRLASLEWVVDPHEDTGRKFAKTYGCEYYPTWSEAVERKKVDAFAIVSSSHTHVELIKNLAPLRKPIFCEKPIAIDTVQVRHCLSILKEYQVPFLLGFNRRYDANFSMLKKRLSEGEIGEVQMLNIISRDHPAPSLAYLKTSGGMFHDMTIHDFDMSRWLFGEEVTEVFATGSTLLLPDLKEFGDVDSSIVVLKTASGKLAQINNSRFAAYGYDQRIEVFGQKGMLRCENVGISNVEKFAELGTSRDNPHYSFPQRYKEGFRSEMMHFLEDVVRDGRTPQIGPEDGLQANLIADAARKSLVSGKVERV